MATCGVDSPGYRTLISALGALMRDAHPGYDPYPQAYAPSLSRNPTSAGELKIGPVGLRQRNQPLVKEIAVVLVACGRPERRILHAAPALDCHPGHREGARVLDKDRNVDRVAVGCKLPALPHMQLVGMRCAIVVDIGLGRNADCIDDESVTLLVLADRFPVRGWLHTL